MTADALSNKDEVAALELAIKGILFDASEEEVRKHNQSKERIERILEENGDIARLALALLGAKLTI